MNHLMQSLKRLLHDREEEPPEEEPETIVACRHAAEQGEAEAQHKLGDRYYNGEGVPQNYTTAAEWYRRAADQGHAAAQFQLGSMHRVGLGVLQDRGEAIRWLKRAADQGDRAAQALLDNLTRQAPPVSNEFLEAVSHLHTAADQGHAGAQELLGSLYETGNGVACDPVAAFAWNERALTRLESGPLHDEALHRQRRLTAALSPEEQARARQFMVERQVGMPH